jgi:hypothetical protein
VTTMATEEVKKKFNEKCRKGLHPLETIMSNGCDMESVTVRWCPICGSISVDQDFDGRTNPGAIRPMRRAAILEP